MSAGTPAPRPVIPAAVALGTVAILSFFLKTTANFWGGRALAVNAPSLGWLADLCLPSMLVSLALYLLIRPERPLARPVAGTNWPRVRRTGGIWLLCWLTASAATAFHAGHWIHYSQGLVDSLAFVVFAPLGEELVFRGAVFELAARTWPAAGKARPIIFSAVFFALHHFQMHHYQPTPAALSQVAFTFPMGLVFGYLRSESQSLWPAYGLHLLTNLPGIF